MRSLPAAIKALRIRSGLTQSDVATTVGIDRANYAHIEDGRRPGTEAQLVAIAAALRVPITAITADEAVA